MAAQPRPHVGGADEDALPIYRQEESVSELGAPPTYQDVTIGKAILGEFFP